MPTVYRLLHKPTGLYFCPSREIRVLLQDGTPWQAQGTYVKSNLSRTGKTYLRKPSLKQIGSHYYTHLIKSVRELNSSSGNSRLLPVLESEWEIEEVA